MAKIMAVNAGSSSIKFQLLDMPAEAVIASGVMERIGLEEGIFTLKYDGKKEETHPVLPTHAEGVELLLHTLVEKGIVKDLKEISGVGHRVVQGGEYFKDSCLVDETVINKIAELADLAPLHNPAHIIGIKAFQKALPKVPQVVVFDTVFHQTMPEEAYMYAVPYEWYEKYGIRKYGAHGTSHKYVSERCAEVMGKPLKDTKIIVCHLGNGASISAVEGGKCKDTSMGLTPLEGIPMGTRTGNIDPTVVSYICDKEGKTAAEVVNILNKKSGYLGMSGRSNDARDVTAGMNSGDHRCKLTFDVQAKRIADYVASYWLYMGGCDAICFTAGMGENLKHLRLNVAKRLAPLGVEIDEVLNDTFSDERIISTPSSKIKLYIIPTNEEVMIARDTVRVAKIK
ncbi:MAG: acetate kinase [Roseburia sp.]|nr:acetate kinase [Anaeroplasma bactoclasticum]MCM1195476.1 acetate kinase [Roseburia sp.]MCM1555954.1 acetate kinase [Anaeroplasma bactoclasticum]